MFRASKAFCERTKLHPIESSTSSPARLPLEPSRPLASPRKLSRTAGTQLFALALPRSNENDPLNGKPFVSPDEVRPRTQLDSMKNRTRGVDAAVRGFVLMDGNEISSMSTLARRSQSWQFARLRKSPSGDQ
jgi:hypothetical protein